MVVLDIDIPKLDGFGVAKARKDGGMQEIAVGLRAVAARQIYLSSALTAYWLLRLLQRNRYEGH